ncbi:MAG: cytochrome c oxidase subunit II [Planctomycetes bacterium]|nr:cytochrome c oxidase subunit II [Planctomycetota bacterium]
MRALVATLFALFAALAVWSFAVAPAHGWAMPENVATLGTSVDELFGKIQWIVGAFFVLTVGGLAWIVWRSAQGGGGARSALASHTKLEVLWTVVPGAILVWLALVQIAPWEAMKFSSSIPRSADGKPKPPLCEVWASQFDWRALYPGADGRCGTGDDLHSPYELVVPVNEPVVLALHSRDVIHSFFVPSFRLKQDILPGRETLVWFECTKPGTYDLLCAELCGWGHYKMAGSVRALPRAEYEQFLERKTRELSSNGMEDTK